MTAASLVFLVATATIAVPWVDRFRVVRPIGLEVRRVVPPDASVYAYAFREPSLFFYADRTFPIVGGPPQTLLCGETPAYVVAKESTLMWKAPDAPYTVVARKAGFAEDGGEMTLLLVRSDPSRCAALQRSTNTGAESSRAPDASRTRAK
jgi:hypothetical protein